MSNPNPGNNGQNGQNGTNGKKPNILVRAWKAGKRLILKIEEKPLGRAAIKVGKASVAVGTVYGAYKFGYGKGAKSVVPTTVYIKSGDAEEDPDDVQDEEEILEEEPVETDETEV